MVAELAVLLGARTSDNDEVETIETIPPAHPREKAQKSFPGPGPEKHPVVWKQPSTTAKEEITPAHVIPLDAEEFEDF